jgi:hypothetical protein
MCLPFLLPVAKQATATLKTLPRDALSPPLCRWKRYVKHILHEGITWTYSEEHSAVIIYFHSECNIWNFFENVHEMWNKKFA